MREGGREGGRVSLSNPCVCTGATGGQEEDHGGSREVKADESWDNVHHEVPEHHLHPQQSWRHIWHLCGWSLDLLVCGWLKPY